MLCQPSTVNRQPSDAEGAAFVSKNTAAHSDGASVRVDGERHGGERGYPAPAFVSPQRVRKP